MAKPYDLPRKVTIGSLMYAMWGDYPGLETRLDELAVFVDEMARRAVEAYPETGLDLAILPEAAITGEIRGTASETSTPLEGPILDVMGEKAREHSTYIIIPTYLAETDARSGHSNAAILLDREGMPAGIYRKVHPVGAKVLGDLEGGVAPGRSFPVFDCDFGRLGAQICFDINFEDGWEALSQAGAEIVVWPTQSPQTVLPSAMAHRHGYFIVSSTWRNNATLFEPTGMIAAHIHEPENILVHQIDLSYALLPWQPGLKNGEAMSARYGGRVGYHYSEAEDGGIFWSNDPTTPICEMVAEMGLETVDELLARNLALQDSIRGGPPTG